MPEKGVGRANFPSLLLCRIYTYKPIAQTSDMLLNEIKFDMLLFYCQNIDVKIMHLHF